MNQKTAHAVKSVTDHKDADISLTRIIDERLRQASLSFNLAALSTTASTTVTTASLILLLSGGISQKTMTAIGNFALSIASAICLKLSKDANDRLDKLLSQVSPDVKEIPKNEVS